MNPFHGCTWHQKNYSPPALVRARCLVRCYGSRCEDRVCRVPARYDHFSAIRSVSWRSFLSRERWLREFAGVSFDSDYSGEGDASFLLFFEVCCCFSARGHHLWSSRILLTNYFLSLVLCKFRCPHASQASPSSATLHTAPPIACPPRLPSRPLSIDRKTPAFATSTMREREPHDTPQAR
jgi:hypothetical protein